MVVGGVQTGIMLWETCVIPFLLNNASVWLQMKESDMRRLFKIENYFFNSLLAVRNCPSMSLYWETGSLVMPMRILKEKLILYHHISCLPANSPALQILSIQERLHLPSLRDEIQSFLRKYEVVDVRQYSKEGWRRFVRSKVILLNREYIIEESKKYKKT